MDHVPATQRVEVTFVGTPPTRQIEQAQGVGDVHVDGQTVRWFLDGQPGGSARHEYRTIDAHLTIGGSELVIDDLAIYDRVLTAEEMVELARPSLKK